jgi:hypothetical protein
MPPIIAINVSPFNCRWIERGSERHFDDWHCAICTRVRNAERLVNETDCARCAAWEAPDDTEAEETRSR